MARPLALANYGIDNDGFTSVMVIVVVRLLLVMLVIVMMVTTTMTTTTIEDEAHDEGLGFRVRFEAVRIWGFPFQGFEGRFTVGFTSPRGSEAHGLSLADRKSYELEPALKFRV